MVLGDDGNDNTILDVFVPGSWLLLEDAFPHHLSVGPQEQPAGKRCVFVQPRGTTLWLCSVPERAVGSWGPHAEIKTESFPCRHEKTDPVKLWKLSSQVQRLVYIKKRSFLTSGVFWFVSLTLAVISVSNFCKDQRLTFVMSSHFVHLMMVLSPFVISCSNRLVTISKSICKES